MGRKRKLSTYRSRKDVQKKKHKVINQRNTAFNQNYTKLKAASSDSEDVNILDSNSSSNSELDDLNFSDTNLGLPTNILTNDASDENMEQSPSLDSGNFRENCLEKLRHSSLLSDVVTVLYESGQLNDFMHLLEYLSDKTFPCTNIVFVLLMERIRFQSCSNTIGMRYCGLSKKCFGQ